MRITSTQPWFVVLVDDGIEPAVVGAFASAESADDYIVEIAEQLAAGGVSAKSRRLPLQSATTPISDVVELFFEQRSAELRRLRAAHGAEQVQGESTIGGGEGS